MAAQTLRKALYVDDDADICEVVQTTLCVIAGLDVQVAHSGQEAIDLAYEFRPDLILMDVMMPGLDGPSTLKRLRERVLLAHIPIIFLTAKVLPSEITRFKDLGALGVLEKPFDPGRLCNVVLALWDGVHISPKDGVGPSTSLAPPPGDALTASFLERADRAVVRLRDIVSLADSGDPAVLREIEQVAHSLHGSAAMFGFPKVSALSGRIERLVDGETAQVPSSGSIGAAALQQQLRTQTEELALAVESAARVKPSGTAICQGGVCPPR